MGEIHDMEKQYILDDKPHPNEDLSLADALPLPQKESVIFGEIFRRIVTVHEALDEIDPSTVDIEEVGSVDEAYQLFMDSILNSNDLFYLYKGEIIELKKGSGTFDHSYNTESWEPNSGKTYDFSHPENRKNLKGLVREMIIEPEQIQHDTNPLIPEFSKRLLEEYMRIEPRIFVHLGITNIDDFVSQMTIRDFYLLAITAPQQIAYRKKYGSHNYIVAKAAIKSLAIFASINIILYDGEPFQASNIPELIEFMTTMFAAPLLPTIQTIKAFRKSGAYDSQAIRDIAAMAVNRQDHIDHDSHTNTLLPRDRIFRPNPLLKR